MPATVKSLEDRIDDMAEDLTQVKVQGAVLERGLSGVQTQLAALTTNSAALPTHVTTLATKFELVADEVKNTRLKLDAMAVDYTAFKSKAETTFALVRWIGVFTAGVFVTVIIGGFTVARSAGSLEATILQQQKVLDQQQKSLEAIQRDLGELRGRAK